MTGMTLVAASTALSPEWDRWFDEEFTDLVTADDDLVHAEFDPSSDDVTQPAHFGQPHHRFQAGTRHQIRIIERGAHPCRAVR